MKIEKKFCKCCNSLLEQNIFVKDKKYHFCNNCNSVFLNEEFYLTSENQKDRYLLHNNTLEDEISEEEYYECYDYEDMMGNFE